MQQKLPQLQHFLIKTKVHTVSKVVKYYPGFCTQEVGVAAMLGSGPDAGVDTGGCAVHISFQFQEKGF